MTRTVTIPRQALPADGFRPGGWWHDTEAGGRIHCDLCPRACALKPGDRGFCFVRENVDGEMALSTYGRSTGFCVDPIEKKPLNHFLPGTAVLSFGTAGCNLGCKFCQNWDISKSREVARISEAADPETIAEAAKQLGCHSVAFTYNDPVVWAEYAVDTARACHARGLQTVAVTAGYITPAARPYFFREMDAANVDLKAFNESFYQQLTYSHLQPVLDTLVWLKQETNVWFEITNLIIPGENDSPDEVRQMCDWIVEHLGDEVPVHFTAFHPDFRLRDHSKTQLETLLQAFDLATAQGIKYVYVGNVHDPVHDSTYCPHCSALLIERNWYELGAYHLNGNRCHRCHGTIAGRFLDQPGTWGRRRQPVRISNYASHPAAEPNNPPSKPDQSGARPGFSDCGTAETRDAHDDRPANGEPPLTESQRQQVFRAACEFVIAGVLNRPAHVPDATLSGAADTSVMGVFVTLKRKGHLRACCGSLGHSMPLADALRGAAHRTATDDRRLAPISATELPYLDIDVSILSQFCTVQAEGLARVDAVEIGRHGLTIHRGEKGGLLLPNVALENSWDSEAFLRQVCRKAGLPPHAWQERESQLQTFESLIIGGVIDPDQLLDAPASPSRVFTPQELEALSEHCRTNVLALVQGATPNYYLPSCPDVNVQGLLLIVDLPARGQRPQFVRLSIRPGLPLQATLFQLCEAAARWINNILGPSELDPSLQVRLAVLHDSSTHGTGADPDLRGSDPQTRALIAAQHGRFAWRFDPTLTPEQLLESAVEKKIVYDPLTASLFSFAVDTNAPNFHVNSMPRPMSGPTVRASAVAGTFYPGDPQELDELVDRLFANDTASEPQSYPAIMVPHAGLRFSGHIAAAAYRRVVIPQRVIVLAPKHSQAGVPWAVAPHATWSLPGLQVESDTQLARRLAHSVSRLELDATAHQNEHAIEVQLPLLARLAPQTRVVGIAIGEGDLLACYEFAEELAQAIQQETDPPLLVISTDLNHYASDVENRRLDQIALDAVQTLDPARLFKAVRQNDISMCGLLPAVIVLQTLRNLGAANRCQQVAYGTSADVGGAADRVVGYASLLFA